MKSLANIFRHRVGPDSAYDDAPRPAIYERFPRHHARPGDVPDPFPEYDPQLRHHDDQHAELIEVAQKPAQHRPPSPPQHSAPTHQEVLNYLGQLADDYHLPRRIVYATAQAESSLDPHKPPQANYEMKNGKFELDKNGKKKVTSWDYGLMQVNSSNIFHVDARGRQRGIVKDAHGQPFKIREDIKTDWKANARAGVALLAPAYHLAELEQGPGTTEEDHGQQAYSQYNSGDPKQRERYLKEKKGAPENGADRNFLNSYRRIPNPKM